MLDPPCCSCRLTCLINCTRKSRSHSGTQKKNFSAVLSQLEDWELSRWLLWFSVTEDKLSAARQCPVVAACVPSQRQMSSNFTFLYLRSSQPTAKKPTPNFPLTHVNNARSIPLRSLSLSTRRRRRNYDLLLLCLPALYLKLLCDSPVFW